jgi:hypothetical protein
LLYKEKRMASDRADTFKSLLNRVAPSRRDVLKGLLLASGVLALVAPASSALAQNSDPTGKGKGKGKARGKRKAKGKGKGKGKGKSHT